MKQETHQLEIAIKYLTELCLPAETISWCTAHLMGRDGTIVVLGPAQTKKSLQYHSTQVQVTGRQQVTTVQNRTLQSSQTSITTIFIENVTTSQAHVLLK